MDSLTWHTSQLVGPTSRDAARYLCRIGVDFAVPAGCLDGVVSRSRDADTYLPDVASNLTDLVRNFCHKNFIVEELIILSGRGGSGEELAAVRAEAEEGEGHSYYHNNLAMAVTFHPDGMGAAHRKGGVRPRHGVCRERHAVEPGLR
uniref:Uncharacterized protein n=1 Tax=Oryza brachyantha TaxID=4533 RepID=J3MN45_ORYBR